MHGVEQSQCALDVVVPVPVGVLDRFRHQGPGREVHHGVVVLLGEDRARVEDRGLDEPRRRHDRVVVAGRQVVEDRDVVIGRDQRCRDDAADIARAAGHQYPHGISLSMSRDQRSAISVEHIQTEPNVAVGRTPAVDSPAVTGRTTSRTISTGPSVPSVCTALPAVKDGPT